MKTKILLALALVFGIGLTNVDAQGIKQRSKAQKVRVVKGVKSGEITKGEAKLLRKQQKNIRRTAIIAKKNDGKIGPKERAIITKKQNRASKSIHRAKHNPRKRG